MNTTTAAETAQTLPPLPEPAISYGPTDYHRGYTAEQMHAYVAPVVRQRDELLEALDSCAGTLQVFVDDGSAHTDSVIGKNAADAWALIAKVKGENNHG